jgi:hypothetical protein
VLPTGEDERVSRAIGAGRNPNLRRFTDCENQVSGNHHGKDVVSIGWACIFLNLVLYDGSSWLVSHDLMDQEAL